MKINENIEQLANAYNEMFWTNYCKCFEQVIAIESEFKYIPSDILNVLIGLLGSAETKKWISKKIKALDNNSVEDLINSDIGLKALKMFLLSMPN